MFNFLKNLKVPILLIGEASNNPEEKVRISLRTEKLLLSFYNSLIIQNIIFEERDSPLINSKDACLTTVEGCCKDSQNYKNIGHRCYLKGAK